MGPISPMRDGAQDRERRKKKKRKIRFTQRDPPSRGLLEL